MLFYYSFNVNLLKFSVMDAMITNLDQSSKLNFTFSHIMNEFDVISIQYRIDHRFTHPVPPAPVQSTAQWGRQGSSAGAPSAGAVYCTVG